MIINHEKKFVFIEVPKTGTSAIATMLQKIDANNKRNYFYNEGNSDESISTHATYDQISERLGHQKNDFQFIAFLRHPTEVVVSKYYFYKIGRSWSQVKNGTASNGLVLRVYFARILPLSLWAMIYPYKSTHRYILTSNGDCQIDFIGDFSNLQRDVEEIFSRFGYTKDQLQLTTENKSDYSNNTHQNNWLLRFVIGAKSRRDLAVYKNVINNSVVHK